MQEMSNNLWLSVDPQWAWSPWQPEADQAWDLAKASHLYRRAGFGASREQSAAAVASGLPQVLDDLMNSGKNSAEYQSTSDQLSQAALSSGDSKGLAVWWLRDMLESQTPLVEKMTLFWHGHFATGADKVKEPQVMLSQNRLLRQHAIGDFSQMVHAISQDAAMLVYLDSAVNRKAHPNENFARELMELFCLGEGNYSERDVQELARCFTGWEVRRNQFRFNTFQHDTASKQVLGNTVESGQDAVRVVLQQPSAAMFIAGKLFRFFIADEPTPPAALLKPIADQLVHDNWNVAKTLRMLLGSKLMFSPSVRGRKVRPPIEWALNWMKACELSTNLKRVSESLAELGQTLFYPPNVKGWDGGRAWINSSTLVGRTNLVSQMVRDPATRWHGSTVSDFWRQAKVNDSHGLCNWLQDCMLAVPLRGETKERLTLAMNAAGGIARIEDCLTLAAALPELQLS